ncbi:MAG: peptide chain release factor N(5)-glutamine methyltransferase [Hyphomicrobiaceae bacterium]|nr:peptide chain release factor N(5)-glutamine methyltransferase [Hyphomicrobiaceae bacterium]
MVEENVGAATRRVAQLLAQSGVDTPERDARLLVAAAIGGVPADLIVRPERLFAAAEAAQLDDYVGRRARREPVSRILGTRDFYGRTFSITPATLDPRPCSETLIGAVLDIADEGGGRDRPLRLLDIGTGSGCLAVTLLCELPNALALATDVSAEALAAAEDNAEANGVAGRISFAQRNTLQDVAGPFDILISNPPYIPAGEISALQAEVKDYDPRGALDGGTDGLDIYREIAAGLATVVPRGWVVLEVGAGQARDVEEILRAFSPQGATAHCRTWIDLGGHTRCVAMETQL